MRLLHATTLEFGVFHDDQIPPYLILSHTWGNEEVNYQEMCFLQQYRGLPDTLKNNVFFVTTLMAAVGLDVSSAESKPIENRSGFTKIIKSAELSRRMELDYFWIDTCCIDKSSSAELQEAINSMYRWYKLSDLCIVYLEDFQCLDYPISFEESCRLFCRGLAASRWLSRGWTLQELIAPFSINFYDMSWHFIGQKLRFIQEIAHATGIPENVLKSCDPTKASVAQKMSWAASRSTTRTEDAAYSLMGLFEIHMPLLYGEGKNAFRRLQEEIIRTTPDDSIFAWEPSEESHPLYSGLLASSPKEFSRSVQVNKGRGVFAVSNLGLRMEAGIAHATPMQMGPFRDKLLYVCVLGATWKEDRKKFALLVQKLAPSTYTRLPTLIRYELDQRLRTETMYFEHTPNIPYHFANLAVDRFHLLYMHSGQDVPDSRFVSSVRPDSLWDQCHQTILVPDNTSSHHHEAFLDNLPTWDGSTGRCFFCVVVLDVQPFRSRQILLRYSVVTREVWCTILPDRSTSNGCLDLNAPHEQWRNALLKLNKTLPKRDHDRDGLLTVSFCSGLHHHMVTIEIG